MEQAYRITDPWKDLDRLPESYNCFDDTRMCYWKEDGDWWLYIPRCGAGYLRNHQVVEHEDGTISVTPSILMYGHDQGRPITRHGYLTRGIWAGCADDVPPSLPT